MDKKLTGHLLAIFTVAVWGTTYISSKILLTEFTPVELLFTRFIMGSAALFIASPRIVRPRNIKQEITFALAGLFGITLYYLFENIALTRTFASNVGVIISAAPFFTVISEYFFSKGKEKAGRNFFVGFVIAMAGIYILSFKSHPMVVNPVGDLLALLAAAAWAVYSPLIKKAGTYGYGTVVSTRRVFEYGTVFMIPAMIFWGYRPDLTKLAEPVYAGNLLFLGFCASALCFATWNYSVKVLGPVKTSAYIYMSPVITLISSVIILHEPVNGLTLLGAALTMSGLFISEMKQKK